MQSLTRIWDSTSLKKSAVYQIDGCLYKFKYSDPYASIKHPQFIFEPLPGQRRKTDLKLNQRKLETKVYEVPGMQQTATIQGGALQLTLDLGRLESFRGE